jgi:predicted nucleic acid-binding protein
VKVGIDTNILVYAASADDARKRDIAQRLLRAVRPIDICFPTQVAGEFYNVATKKLKLPPARVVQTLKVWSEIYGFRSHGEPQILAAATLSSDHGLQIWDALIFTVAVDDGCALFLSEDMQDGFVYRGVTVANPFAERIHPLLASLMDSLTPSRPAGAPE